SRRSDGNTARARAPGSTPKWILAPPAAGCRPRGHVSNSGYRAGQALPHRNGFIVNIGLTGPENDIPRIRDITSEADEPPCGGLGARDDPRAVQPRRRRRPIVRPAAHPEPPG